MAEIRPFRGWTYDTSRIDATSVLAPPYDVISDSERDELAGRSEHNAAHVILPSGNGDEKYANAASTLEGWKQSGALKRSERAAIYRYHQIFEHPLEPGREMIRRGFIAAVRLHEFSDRIILPHERTLKGPKIDRLALMRATRCHTSQIFTLYSDPSGASDQLFEPFESRSPAIDGVTDDGTRHKLWVVEDRELIGDLGRIVNPANLYIADGHHRYETMVAWRNELEREAGGQLSSASSAGFGTMFVANMDDPGMVVLPTHRLVHSVAEFDGEELVAECREHFDITTVDATAPAIRSVLAKCERPAFVLALRGQDKPLAHLFELRAPVKELGGVLGRLDVTVLHQLVLDNKLGIDKAALEAKSNIDYLKSDEAALALLGKGRGQALFLMRATPVSQVKLISDAAEFMPQKSTFFVPKIASGMVYRMVDPDEELT